jgi:hypothetical protein
MPPKLYEMPNLDISDVNNAKLLMKAGFDTLRKIESLKSCTDIATSKGNYDVSDYMLGMANGLILALAIMQGTEPKYL